LIDYILTYLTLKTLSFLILNFTFALLFTLTHFGISVYSYAVFDYS